MRGLIKKMIEESARVKLGLCKGQLENIENAAKAIVKALRNGNKLLIFGNGGSAADSQHIAAELVGRFKKERRSLAAIALTTNTSTLSAIANDYGYNTVFSRQVESLGKKGDAALGISTSGNSSNVIEALKSAKSLGLITIALTGGRGGSLKKDADISIVVDSDNTPRVQESHIMIGHILCELIENEICGASSD